MDDRLDRDPPPQLLHERTGVSVRTVLLCLVILAAGVGLAALALTTEPRAVRSGATKRTAMLVDVTAAEHGTFRPTLVATGTVKAERDVVLRSQVAGKVVARDDEFMPGGLVERGQTLLRVEAADYKNLLQQRQSELLQASSDLDIEMGRQRVARKERELFGDGLADAEQELMLRGPQLEAARGRVEAARAARDQAQLELRRTTVEAPFAAQILRRDVDVGSHVAVGDALGRLVGLQTYWVEVSLPLPKLRFIAVPKEQTNAGSTVRIRNRATWPEGVYREGRVERLVGAVDEQTRLARVLVSIPDPLSRRDDAPPDEPALIVGEFVEVQIEGEALSDVVAFDRDYLREGDTVWVMADDDSLGIREVVVALTDAERAYVARGLSSGERIVTSNLSTVVEGAPLRLRPDADEAPAP